MRWIVAWLVLAAALGGCVSSVSETGARDTLVLGTTTSLQDTGLLDALLPAYARDTGHRVIAVVGGTGEVHEKAKRGDVGVLLTHSPLRERALVADGWATERRPVMSNRFVLAGPAADPAGIAGAMDARDALARIHAHQSVFVSRGDGSGTHEKERALWSAAGLDADSFDARWYKETGSGQGPTLLYAHERDAYVLTDEGTLRQFHAHGKATRVVELHHDASSMRNPYAVTLLDPARVPAVPSEAARAFADWITGPRGQTVIAAHAVHGAPLFTPNAGEPAA